jgi:hypothetical protein
MESLFIPLGLKWKRTLSPVDKLSNIQDTLVELESDIHQVLAFIFDAKININSGTNKKFFTTSSLQSQEYPILTPQYLLPEMLRLPVVLGAIFLLL